MAMSKDAQPLTERIKEVIAFTKQMKTDLEEKVGLLYSNGKLQELTAAEIQNLKLLHKAFDDLYEPIEKFQKDSLEVYGLNEVGLTPDMRPEKGRDNAAAPDSGIGSTYMPSPQSSCSRLSRSNTGNVDSIAEHIEDPEEPEKAELYNPSSNESSGNSITDRNSNEVNDSNAVSDINRNALVENTARKSTPSFYLETPPSSTTSLTNHYQDGCVFPPTLTDELNTTKEVNDLNKTLSEENNAKQNRVPTG